MNSRRINLWHFAWIAVVLSVLLSLLLSKLIDGRILWRYPFSATIIACLVAGPLIYVIQRLLNLEKALVERQVQQADERIKTEIALHESQLRFRYAFHEAPIAMALGTLEGKWLMVNSALCALVGYTEEELMVVTYKEITHPNDLDVDLALFQKLISGELRTYQLEKRYIHKQGHVVWIFLTLSLIRGPAGQPLYCIAQMQDITERKRALDDLANTQMLFQAILDNSPNMIFLKDTAGRYLLVNRQFETIFHVDRQSISGRTDDELFPREQAITFQRNDRKVLESGMPMEFEECAQHDDGPHTSIVVKFPVRMSSGEIHYLGGITTDITARKKAEQAVKDSEHRLRLAFDDRDRLSQDLHDHVIQSIFAIGMTLETCIFLLDSDPKRAVCKLESGIAELNSIIAKLRDYVQWGGGNTIKADQFSQTLEEFVRTVADTNFPIKLEIDSLNIRELTDEVVTQIMHIVREALSNTLRHANANSSTISLFRTDEQWLLDVHDDGIGFDPKTKNGYGWGLRNMATRAAKINAKFQITSECGKGTRISLAIPRAEHAQSR
jgi:PAS domain S-box-containing protein